MSKISLVVVTYNRLALLKECMESVFKFSDLLSHIIIVDNASDLETKNYLVSLGNKIDYIRLEKNLGGAGGFYIGIKYFTEKTSDDYVWVMDDDTIPNKKSLNELIKAAQKFNSFGFLASDVRWIDGSPAKMNIPSVEDDLWTENKDYVRLKRATFVSIVISRVAIETVGYPIKEFFIWGDDTEYTKRISSKFASYFVGSSEVLHKMKGNIGADLMNDSVERIDRYFYAYRNRYYNAKHSSKKVYTKYRLRVLNEALQLLFGSYKNKFRRLSVLIKGTFAGIFFKPDIEVRHKLNDKV
ncbi:glycosyltransferase [Latilactobacillus curvatus]|uniref:Glycosyltransferase n=1 Tax=Latilactobacillus curvatus TaxID=28038 RepID=A0A385ACF2_LATCU|nr:glycosyltransferase family 2 protein [Latilactobacillus curvatus]AXN35351.1 glycosyltransferase [Latilactobacillus curvatus]